MSFTPHTTRLLAAIAVSLCAACSSSPADVKAMDAAAPQQDGATSDAAPQQDGATGPDAGAPQDAAGSDATTASPEMPQVVSLAVVLEDAASPVVIPSPQFVPIFFASDDASTTAQLTTFLSELVSSSYWASVTSEYGVGAATVHAPVQLPAADNPGATVDDSQISAWLTQQLDPGDAGSSDAGAGAGDAGLPPADGNTIYVFFYPTGTTVTFGGSAADGYHTMTSQNVPYAVLPRVSQISASGPVGTLSLSGFELLTFSTSHEMVEAVTDPLGTGYFGWDTDQAYWFDFLGAELADTCQFETPGTLASYTVARVWSNKAAAAGTEPCVPAPSGEVYFNSAAILGDTVGWALPFQGAPTQSAKGVHIPVGESATVDLALFSPSPTTGPWSVSAEDLSALNGGTAQLQFTFDKTSGQAGDTVHMTIKVLSAGEANSELFEVTSTLGSQKEYWFGIVGN